MSPRPRRRIKAIDFFCGAGGLSRGLLDAGVRVLAGVDNDPSLAATYDRNNLPSRFVRADVRGLDVVALRRDLGITDRDVVAYAACTPCQPFSSLTRMRRDDDRKDLLLAFAKLVEAAPPDFIVVENVPGLNHAYGREVHREFMEALSRVGFDHLLQGMLDARDYGVPQVRKRYIMLASRLGPVLGPRRSRRRPTVKDAISRFPPLPAGGSSAAFPNHVARPLRPHLEAIVKAVPPDGGSRSDIRDASILLECHKGKAKVHRDVFGRLSWDRPSPTMTCRCTDVYCGRFVHPEQDRGLSLREAAALQTFPDHYEFHGGSIHQLARQIGNAVPVEFARRLGDSVIRSHRALNGRRAHGEGQAVEVDH